MASGYRNSRENVEEEINRDTNTRMSENDTNRKTTQIQESWICVVFML